MITLSGGTVHHVIFLISFSMFRDDTHNQENYLDYYRRPCLGGRCFIFQYAQCIPIKPHSLVRKRLAILTGRCL